METKKSYRADLDNKRTTGFLLGLIVALSLFFVAMEYTSYPPAYDDEDEMLDDMTQDMELSPKEDRSDMISASLPSAPPAPAITENVKAVDNAPQQKSDKISPNASDILVGNGEGVQKDATVDKAIPQTPVDNPQGVVNFRIVQQIPQFPGGMAAFTKWLTQNLRYPPIAQRQKIQGKVVVSFIINKNGSVSDIKVEQSVNPYLDDEAIRVMRRMPKWSPGMQNDKPCRTLMAVPIVFEI